MGDLYRVCNPKSVLKGLFVEHDPSSIRATKLYDPSATSPLDLLLCKADDGVWYWIRRKNLDLKVGRTT